jgi:hypothetical protein
MLATADPTGGRNTAPATTTQEKRPVRLLVPTRRRSDYWLPLEDTLRASDLGITRHTTDAELEALVAEYGQTSFVTYRDDLYRLRDALRIPRDIAEARAWGFTVPEDENEEESHDDPRRRLGWWWVYDPIRTETREERRDRYRSDRRMIDTKGFARAICRAYITTKDLKAKSDHFRKVVDDAAYRTDLVRTILAANPSTTAQHVEQSLLAEANDFLLKAMPPRRDRAGQSDQWHVSDALDNGRLTGRLNEWYEHESIKQTGRPRGSKTRNRRTKTTTQ